METKKARVLTFDIEASNLAANFGYILAIGYKWLDEPTTTVLSIVDSSTFKKDPTNDLEILEKFRKVWEQADIVIAHYGKKFDVPYLNTRLALHGREILPVTPLIDTWAVAKYKMRLNSNRLDTLLTALNCPTKKTPLDGPTWVKASAGDKKSIAYVVQHCKNDVIALEYCYKKIRGLINDHPKLTNDRPDSCNVCGDNKFRSLGVRRTATSVYRRFICTKCGNTIKGSKV